MTREQIISALKQYFSIKELVCEHTYAKFGEASWQFFTTDFLCVIFVLRKDILRAPMVCNTSTLHQRGLRCNMCDIVRSKKSVYLSAHILGQAADFTIIGMTAEQARQKIKAAANLLPCPVRIEGGVSWLHVDVLHQFGITDKVYEFKV